MRDHSKILPSLWNIKIICCHRITFCGNRLFWWCITCWHQWLGMPIREPEWYQQDYEEEYQEFLKANSYIERLSEASDLAYILTRSHCQCGPQNLLKNTFQLCSQVGWWTLIGGLLYMIPKYTLRSLFYRHLGFCLGISLRDVRNPTWNKVSRLLASQDINSSILQGEYYR